jgi:hypothetical protein
MRSGLVLGLFLASCDSGTKASPPPDKTPPAITASTGDASVAVVTPARAVDLGVVGDSNIYDGPGVRLLLLDGEHVLWSTMDDANALTVRRVPRKGGAVETLGSIPGVSGSQGHRNMALVGDELFVTGSANATNAASLLRSRAPIFKLEDGKLREVARGPTKTGASTGLLAYSGKLYWTAAGPTGSGPLMETTPTGATRTALCDAPADLGCEHHLLDGVPPIATNGTSLWKLGAKAEKLAVTCPDCTEPTTVVDGNRILCVPTPAADSPSATCKPVPTLVALDGKTVAPPGLGGDVQRASGRYYHLVANALLHRPNLEGADQTYASKVQTFAADDNGVAWIGEDKHLWAAPH